jgi:hypothetical protein
MENPNKHLAQNKSAALISGWRFIIWNKLKHYRLKAGEVLLFLIKLALAIKFIFN